MKLTMATLALAGLVAAAPVADSTRDIALPAAVPSCALVCISSEAQGQCKGAPEGETLGCLCDTDKFSTAVRACAQRGCKGSQVDVDAAEVVVERVCKLLKEGAFRRPDEA